MSVADYGNHSRISGLRKLWRDAFGDDDAFLDIFFSTAYDPSRCRCISEDGEILAALYWFDTTCNGQKLAYLYAIATAPSHRKQGLCRLLLEDTLGILRCQGYAGALLVPAGESLKKMYEKLGFLPCTTVNIFSCTPAQPAADIQQIDTDAYAQARRNLLPPNSVIQEGGNLAFLSKIARFYEGPGYLAAVSIDGDVCFCQELVGNPAEAPRILAALGASSGTFRRPGSGTDFAMLYPLTPNCPRPDYFGLAFD